MRFLSVPVSSLLCYAENRHCDQNWKFLSLAKKNSHHQLFSALYSFSSLIHSSSVIISIVFCHSCSDQILMLDVSCATWSFCLDIFLSWVFPVICQILCWLSTQGLSKEFLSVFSKFFMVCNSLQLLWEFFICFSD